MKLLGANLSTGVTALVALVLVWRFAKVPWRYVFSAPRRFDRRRLLMYFLGSLAVLPAAGSWFRSVKPAFLTGLVVSSLMFAFLHGSTDPMLFAYYLVFSVATAVMGLLTRGLEAAIAFHTANNLVVTTINALFAGGGVVAERSEGAAGGSRSSYRQPRASPRWRWSGCESADVAPPDRGSGWR